MAKTQILEYTIFLRDAALVADLQRHIAAGTSPAGFAWPSITLPLGGRAIQFSPWAASIEFDLVSGGDGTPPLPYVEKGQAVPTTGPGYITSPWFTSTDSFPRMLRTFTKHTGWWIFGSTTKFYWAGRVALAPGGPASPTLPGEPMVDGVPANELVGFTQYAWAHGEPVYYDGEHGGAGGGAGVLEGRCPGAGRGDGIGTRYASDIVNQDGYTFTNLRNVTPALPPYVRQVWQRLYIRPQKFPATFCRFWNILGSDGGDSAGFSVGLTATGQFALFLDTLSGTTATLHQAFGQTVLGAWTRLDLFCHVVEPTTSKLRRIEIRVNGLLVAQAELLVTGALGGLPDAQWQASSFGSAAFAPVTDAIFDLDDWTCAVAPVTVADNVPLWTNTTAYAVGDVVRYSGQTLYALAASTNVPPTLSHADVWQLLADPVDLTNGTHLVHVKPTGYSAGMSGWTGDWRVLHGRGGHVTGWPTVSSAVPEAPLEITVGPLGPVVDGLPTSLGWVAGRVILALGRTAGAQLGTLGYQIGSDPVVAFPVDSSESSSPTSLWKNAVTLSLPPARHAPVREEDLLLRYVKGPDALLVGVGALSATLVCVGVFGAEDIAPSGGAMTGPQAPATLHLWEHPDTPWSRDLLPMGPVLVVGATYVGNGTGQDLVFKVPVTFWLVRRVPTGSGGGGHWFSSCVLPHAQWTGGSAASQAPHLGFAQDYSFVPESPEADQQLQFLLRVGGSTDLEHNEAGITYQYIAFCDPAARFSRAFSTLISTLGTPRELPLDDPSFVATVGFVGTESTFGSTTGFCFKGVAHAVDTVQDMGSGTLMPNALTFGTGAVTLGAALVGSNRPDNVAGLLFRRADGNNHPDQAGVFFTGSYVGDGAASRTIGLPPVGRRPLWAQVQGVGAQPYQRDPMHTGVTSSSVGFNAASSTAITGGGVDSFSVGILLNATGVTYHYFGFFAGTDAGNNGWGTNGEYVPVPSDSNKPPDWQEPVITEPPVDPGPGGGDGDPLIDPGAIDTDVDPTCVASSTRLVNIALSTIGITDAVTDLKVEASRNAETARLLYKTEIDAVLRAHVWKFATRYATLTRVAGALEAPVNGDWTFSYRLPADCLLVRRIVPDDGRQRGFDPAPVPFDTTEDADGSLLYANVDHVAIEYTARIDCPARARDPIFRRACTWRLAHAFAAPLGRDKAQADQAFRMYLLQISEAQARDQNEQQPQHPPHVGEAEWIRGRE